MIKERKIELDPKSLIYHVSLFFAVALLSVEAQASLALGSSYRDLANQTMKDIAVLKESTAIEADESLALSYEAISTVLSALNKLNAALGNDYSAPGLEWTGTYSCSNKKSDGSGGYLYAYSIYEKEWGGAVEVAGVKEISVDARNVARLSDGGGWSSFALCHLTNIDFKYY